MKPSQILFSRDLYELDYDFLVDFFSTSKEESLTLEFKSYDTRGNYKEKEEAIKRAVCGMLNSEGGIIIWGAPQESKDEKNNTSAIGNLTPFESPLDRDRFINILSSSIIPLPVGIRVEVLKNENQQSVFVIEVEKAIEKPYQFDNRYYIRLDGQTRIAPHYLVSALMKGINFPILSGHLRLKNITHDGLNVILSFRNVLFNTSAYNNEINLQLRFVVSIGNLLINGKYRGDRYVHNMSLLSYGTPHCTDFELGLPAAQFIGEISILFQFGGEKSPSKMSTYTYRFNNLRTGLVHNENLYLVEKKENILPQLTNDFTQNIEEILNS